jgi:nicotinate-nucleotide adenylyltransferase
VSPDEVRRALPAWSVASDARIEHIARVAALLERWARERGVGGTELARWHRAAVLHDALRDAGEDVLRRYGAPPPWPLKTWHGPAAAAAAAADGERDQGVLDAVRFHSFGFARWDEAGRMLYLADYLEPGRPYERAMLDAWIERAGAEPATVLREVAALRIAWRLKNGGRLAQETWEFWNSIAAA